MNRNEPSRIAWASLARNANALSRILLRRASARYREKEFIRRTGSSFPNSIANVGCLFIHVPKAAGTSISFALYGEYLGHKTYRDWESRYPASIRRIFTFAVVRDPMRRYVSAFNYLKRGGVNEDDRRFADLCLKNYGSAEELSLALKNVSLRKRIMSGVHFKEQHRFVVNSRGRVAVDLLIPIEKLQVGIAEVSKRINREIVLGKLNASDASPPELSKEAASVLHEIYRKDLTLHASALRRFEQLGAPAWF